MDGRLARLLVQLAFGTVTVLPPRLEKRFSKEPLEVWAMRVWEEQTPAGEEPEDADSGDLGLHYDARAGLGARRVV